MAEREHEDLAEALSRLADGDVAPSEQQPPAPLTPPPPPPVPAAEKVVRPAMARAAAPRLAPQVSPQQARPAAPAPSNNRSAAPPAARLQRPAAPTLRTILPSDAEVDGGQSTGLTAQSDDSTMVDDDDAVIVPAPDASAFIPRDKADARARAAQRKSLEMRRTLIPILLTLSVCMMIFGSLKFVLGPDSMLATMNSWIPSVLLGGSALLLIVAVVNMLSVKNQLDRAGQERATARQ